MMNVIAIARAYDYVERAERVIARYARHDRTCPLHTESNLPGDPRCTCGFSASAAELDAKHTRLMEISLPAHLIDNLLDAIDQPVSEALQIGTGSAKEGL